MKTFHFLLVCGILFTFGALTRTAEAHSIPPLKAVSVHAGPYPLTVNYYSEPRGGQALVFSIVPETMVSGSLSYHVTAIPGTTVHAVPVKAILEVDSDHPGAVQGVVNLPVSGQWLLAIDIAGSLGSSSANAPILAGAPPAIPEWLGWLIGLVPIWAMIGLILWQARPAKSPAAAWR